MKLRPYQGQAKGSIEVELREHISTLAVLPTGCGKTIVFGHVARDWNGGRVMVIAHREELIFQARDKIQAVAGFEPEIEMGELRAGRSGLFGNSPVVVSSVQSLNAGTSCPHCDGGKTVSEDDSGNALECHECLDGIVRRMQRFNPFEFGLVIVDEAHHATARTYRRAIDYFCQNPDCRVLGVTATPDRGDEAALGRVFDSVAFEYGVVDAINDGWLVPIHQEWVICEDLDFSRVRTTAGDLNNTDLEQILTEEEALHQVVTPTLELSGDMATLLFATSVAHAELMAEILNRHKPKSAICIHGGTPGELRRELLKRYSQGEFQYLCGCGVFLEGFDEPRIQCVAMARPTKSRALYAQAIGRGTRPLFPPSQDTPELRKSAIAVSAKPRLLVLDFVGNSGQHKLVSTADVLGGNYEQDVIERAVKNSQQQGAKPGGTDMVSELVAAQHDADEERRQQREAVRAKAKFTRQSVDPFDVFDLTPRREPGWHKGREPSEKQRAVLERAGIPTKDVSFHQASQLIDTMFKRRDEGLCTYKQAKILAKYGQPTNIGFAEARAIIDAIAANGWRPIEKVSV